MPQDRTIDIVKVRQKIIDFAMHLIYAEPEQVSCVQDKEMEHAMQFIDSLMVSGGKDIPVDDDSIENLVEQKY